MSARKVKKEKVVEKGVGMIQYRNGITSMTKEIKKHALTLSSNLLSVKMALMNAVKDIEEMMRDRRQN